MVDEFWELVGKRLNGDQAQSLSQYFLGLGPVQEPPEHRRAVYDDCHWKSLGQVGNFPYSIRVIWCPRGASRCFLVLKYAVRP